MAIRKRVLKKVGAKRLTNVSKVTPVNVCFQQHQINMLGVEEIQAMCAKFIDSKCPRIPRQRINEEED